ncbi:tetratricopeptide repeat protein [Amycolatopsis magusensis]|uniref:tetratricopeptide repeat protein n=1 Tax=Amycolatopsis magusensis TaxID=882444 RepID=UPI003C2C81D3
MNDGQRTDEAAFGALLLRHRRAAGLTQADLAENSGVSIRALSDLERGRALGAQRRSATALADALGLVGGDRQEFLEAARLGRRRTPKTEEESDSAPSVTLPPSVPDLLGREGELAKLHREAVSDAAGGVVVSVVGHPGVGKTALAVTAAHQLRPQFPDGAFALDLRGMDEEPTSPRTALTQLLRALNVPPQQIPMTVPEQSSLFRSLLTGRRILLLLDNAADEAQVRPLLAASPGCLTLITCRSALAGLESARWLWLEPLVDLGAVELLTAIAGEARVRAEPRATAELVALCGNLPLAVRIAGNRLASRPHWTIAYLTTQLRNERTRLSSLSAGDLQVRSAFEMSHRRLSPAARLVFRRLAIVPGPDFGSELAAVATGMAEADVQIHADELVDANLLQAAAAPGRYQFHDLIRIFAVERLEAEEKPGDRDRHRRTMLDHLLHTATEAGRAFMPDALVAPTHAARRFDTREGAGAWLDVEAGNWLAAHREAPGEGLHREVVDLARALHWYSDGRTQQRPWDEIFQRGVDSARALRNQLDEAVLLNFVGWARYFCFGDNDGGLSAHNEALAVAIEIGDKSEQAWALGYRGSVLMRLGRLDEALESVRRAVELSEVLGFWTGEGTIRNALGRILRVHGKHEESLGVHRGVLTDADARQAEANPDTRRFLRSVTLLDIGGTLLAMRDWQEAARTLREARGYFEASGFRIEEADTALHEGIARREAGEYDLARECFTLALSVFTGVANRWKRANTLAELITMLELMGDPTADEYRAGALALCAELKTGAAAELAARLRHETSRETSPEG